MTARWGSLQCSPRPPSSVVDPGGPQGAMAFEFESTEPHRLPPSKSGRKTPSTTPPSNSRNLIDYPPSKSGRKTPSTTPPRMENPLNYQLPPLEFTEPHRLPPSKLGRKTPSTTPPRIHIPRSATALAVMGWDRDLMTPPLGLANPPPGPKSWINAWSMFWGNSTNRRRSAGTG